jgi:hypothetical protein
MDAANVPAVAPLPKFILTLGEFITFPVPSLPDVDLTQTHRVNVGDVVKLLISIDNPLNTHPRVASLRLTLPCV